MHVRRHVREPVVARGAWVVLHVRHPDVYVGRRAELGVAEMTSVICRLLQHTRRVEIRLDHARPAVWLLPTAYDVMLHQEAQADPSGKEAIEHGLHVR